VTVPRSYPFMALHFKTSTPNKLLKAFKKAIDEKRIVTWAYDGDGDFTHTTEQWKNQAWLRPKVKKDEELILTIIKPQDKNISSVIYAIYHGRFLEAMLTHCDLLFTRASATALPSTGDVVGDE